MTPTTPPTETPRSDAAFDNVADIQAAQTVVIGSVLFKKFIDGTPLSNDIAVWMVQFARAKGDFARELERELHLCLAKNTEYQADVIRIAGEIILLRQELESQRPKGYLKQEQVTKYLFHWREYCGKLEAQIVERDVQISILTEKLASLGSPVQSLNASDEIHKETT